MFDGLNDKLQDVFKRLKGEGRVSEEILDQALREIRIALLEADVNFRVVKSFIKRLKERAIGQDVLESLTPAQQVIKIVRDELVVLLGERGTELELSRRPAVVMVCGLQGSGKTTTIGKIARRLQDQGRHPLMVAGDLQRAAAVADRDAGCGAAGRGHRRHCSATCDRCRQGAGQRCHPAGYGGTSAHRRGADE